MEKKNYNIKKREKSFLDFDTAAEALRRKFKVSHTICEEDIKDYTHTNFKVGDKVIKTPPIPNDPVEAFELFKNYYAQIQFELQKHLFIEKYFNRNEHSISAEINLIEDWIKQTNEINYSEACLDSRGNIQNSNSGVAEYLRLQNGFYSDYLMDWNQHSESSVAATIYGRYFIFYDFLKSELMKCKLAKNKDEKIAFISTNNDLDFYYNVQNMPNQDLVFGTIEYFENGKRKGFFQPLQFMNLFWKQYNFVIDNIQKPHSTITTLKDLPLSDEQKHILFGFILKWFGGYPVENLNMQYNTVLRLIEREFLDYEGETPEKEFCQKDWVQYKRLKQIEPMISQKLNDITTGLETIKLFGKSNKSKLDFTKEKLKSTILELASMNGYEKPSTYLNELLNEVKEFNSFEFENDFFLNIHYLCKEYADRFWSEAHKKDISQWLMKAKIVTEVFNTTWESSLPNNLNNSTDKKDVSDSELKANDFEKYLLPIKNGFNSNNDYMKCIEVVEAFFSAKTLPIKSPLFVKNGYVRKLAFALGEIWRDKKNEVISFEYLKFYKKAFSIFKEQELDSNNIFGTNLYKYSISRT
jgi:hypothetical protein